MSQVIAKDNIYNELNYCYLVANLVRIKWKPQAIRRDVKEVHKSFYIQSDNKVNQQVCKMHVW